MLSVIPGGDGLLWDVETDCVVSSGGELLGIMHGSRAFIFDYDDGGSDIYQLPDPNDLAQTSGDDPLDCPGDAINVTNFPPSNEVLIERGNRCNDTYIATEFFESGFGLFKADAPPADWFPVPVIGGANIRSPNCFNVDGNGAFALVGSTPGDGDRSNLVYFLPCGGTCTQASHEPTLLLAAENPGEELINPVVSPDRTKIAFEYISLADSQVWVADFDPQVPAITNASPVTSEGDNGSPTWSPDSQQIAFKSDRDGNLEIYVMNADGSDQQNITNTPDVSEFDPSWMTP
ncbi:MAG: PD40 domain-containing protein [Chloroflexi bacterium]|nr:PD40 domain-containing protein [Chloroflexota bacterium]